VPGHEGVDHVNDHVKKSDRDTRVSSPLRHAMLTSELWGDSYAVSERHLAIKMLHKFCPLHLLYFLNPNKAPAALGNEIKS
jgi:hypothetical protein